MKLYRPGFIAGVTNPIIKQHTSWYDLCCEIETGLTIPCNPEEYKNQRYYQDDREFIEHVFFTLIYEYGKIMGRLVEKQIGEDEIRFSFSEYAQLILDLSLDDYLIFDAAQSKYLADIQWERIFRLKKTKSYELQLMLRKQKEQRIIEGVSYSILELHLRQLKFRKNITSAVMSQILDDIKNYMKEEENILEFLALLHNQREGLCLVATGLFSLNDDVCKKTIEVLNKIQTIKIGKDIFSTLNPIFINAFYKKYAQLYPNEVKIS